MIFTNQTLWDESFKEQIEASSFNTAPVDVIVRNISYYLRSRYKESGFSDLKFLEIGCGGGVNLSWLAHKGVSVSGVDISENALKLCKQRLSSEGITWDNLVHASVEKLPFDDSSFTGVVESCVIQHISSSMFQQTFDEVNRVLKKGGVFIGHMLDRECTAFSSNPSEDGNINFQDHTKPKFYLTNIGGAHFFSEEELKELLRSFAVVDLSKATYFLPQEEGKRRGYELYKQSMWSVYAIK